jgi:hypothetical protein
VLPRIAPARQAGTMKLSSRRSASGENLTPSQSAAATSSGTHMGSTCSNGMKCASNGTVKSDAPSSGRCRGASGRPDPTRSGERWIVEGVPELAVFHSRNLSRKFPETFADRVMFQVRACRYTCGG